MRGHIAVFGLAAALALFHTQAGAQSIQQVPGTQGPNPAVRAACGADVRSLCAGVQPGGGRIKDCMVSHASQLSAGCKAAIQQARAARSGERNQTGGEGQHPRIACGVEVKSLCAGVQPGQGRIVACLESHVGELQPACRTAVQARAKHPSL